jgi:hypothetical protein
MRCFNFFKKIFIGIVKSFFENAPTVSFGYVFVNGRNYRFDTSVAIIRFFFKSALMNASNSFLLFKLIVETANFYFWYPHQVKVARFEYALILAQAP